jgi:uncharacterized protein with HEPN domain
MDDRIQKWLYDIKVAIDEIDSFFAGEPMIFENYQQNKMLKRAVERELEIIGEAMNRIIKRDESFAQKIEDAMNIVGLRNHVIHAYDNISDENIWAIVINHLPRLKKDINTLILPRANAFKNAFALYTLLHIASCAFGQRSHSFATLA